MSQELDLQMLMKRAELQTMLHTLLRKDRERTLGDYCKFMDALEAYIDARIAKGEAR